MRHYDIVIAGGGVAGLSLACHLLDGAYGAAEILIVDRRGANWPDCTYSFWTRQPCPFDEAASQSWKRLRFTSPDVERTVELGDYTYKMMRSEQFYACAYGKLGAHRNVQVVKGQVEAVEDGAQQATVTIDGQRVSAGWAFDNRGLPAGLDPENRKHHRLNLHFLGWEIECERQAFDPRTATLMDFRTPQKGGVCFLYQLPISEQRAFVEYSRITPESYTTGEFRQALQDYLAGQPGLQGYRILRVEGGTIHLDDRPVQRRLGRRVLSIGTRAGMVKPTSGYAFWRIQVDSAAIARSLQQRGHPFDIPPALSRFRLYDQLLLEVIQQESSLAPAIFAELFKNNPIHRLLRFLDEESTIWEDLQIGASLPKAPFARALWSWNLRQDESGMPGIMEKKQR